MPFREKFIIDHQDEIKFEGKFEDSPLLGRQSVASGTLPEFILILQFGISQMRLKSFEDFVRKITSKCDRCYDKNRIEFQSIICPGGRLRLIEQTIKNAEASPI